MGERTWFKKTVIKSCCRFNYDEVQRVIDGEEIEVPPVYRHTWDEIRSDILLLNKVCTAVRRGRFSGGALKIDKQKMIFHTRESDDGVPTGYHIEDHSPSHWLIEELMLLANRCVAKHLADSSLHEVAVLRRHDSPDSEKSKALENVMKNNLGLGWWDASNAGSLYKSCQRVRKEYGETVGFCIDMMIMRAGMMQAEYVVYDPEESIHHCALNFSHYTHFTSPIRRYPDVMVHRVLGALLEDDTPCETQEEAEHSVVQCTEGDGTSYHVRDTAENQVILCNTKKKNSRNCQQQLDVAVFCVYLRHQKEWFNTNGSARCFVEVSKGVAVMVYCSKLGRDKRVLLGESRNNLNLYANGVDDVLHLPLNWKLEGKGRVSLVWKNPETSETIVQDINIMGSAPVVMIPTDTIPISFEIFFVSPFHPRYAALNDELSPAERQGFKWTDTDDSDVFLMFSATAT